MPDQIKALPIYQQLANEFLRPDRFTATSLYFLDHWAAELGPTGCLILLQLRKRCFLNRRTGERREECVVDMEELAAECGISSRTLRREMKSNLSLQRFVRAEPQFVRADTGEFRQRANRYHVSMDDPLIPDHEAEIARRVVPPAPTPVASAGDATAPGSAARAGRSPGGRAASPARASGVAATPPAAADAQAAQTLEPPASVPPGQAVRMAPSATRTNCPPPPGHIGPMAADILSDQRQAHQPDILADPRFDTPNETLSSLLPSRPRANARTNDDSYAMREIWAKRLAEELDDLRSLGFYRKVAAACLAAGDDIPMERALADAREARRDHRVKKSAGALFNARVRLYMAERDIAFTEEEATERREARAAVEALLRRTGRPGGGE